MQTFLNEGQRASHVAALEHERAGYEHRVKHAKLHRNEVAKTVYADRIKQVDAEIERISVLAPVDDAPAEPAPEAPAPTKKELLELAGELEVEGVNARSSNAELIKAIAERQLELERAAEGNDDSTGDAGDDGGDGGGVE